MAKKKPISSMSLAAFKMSDSVHRAVDIVCRILIVCEGEKTEPNYFRSFDKLNRGGIVYDIKCDGGGINTLQVVEKAIELRDQAIQARMPFDSVWVVFDRDSFPSAKFNAAIQKALSCDINCAWSNEAFELWYIYHFVNRTTPMSRGDYQKEITSHLCKKKVGYHYKKNDPNMRTYLLRYGNEEQAIKFAEQQEMNFDDYRFAEHNPATWVYKLVRLLRGEDNDFNERIKAEVDS